jgi:hypothetical protein
MTEMKTIAALAAGVGVVGAGLMYMLDPERGRRPRALVRDKAAKIEHKLVDKGRGRAKDLINRSKGVAAWLRRDGRHNGAEPSYADETAMSRMDTADEARNVAEEVAASGANAGSLSLD